MDNFDRLKTLISLATSDGELAEKERQFILSVGQANHLMVAEILPLFVSREPASDLAKLTQDQKGDLLLELVQLMRIDERVYQAEIKYCAQLASKLGYREEVLFELMLLAKTATLDLPSLRKLLKGFLKG
jgi:uncharacterized membrane protein YebE (DUF533 family)